MNESEKRERGQEGTASRDSADQRPPYEPPRILKKRSVSRVTLFTGGGPPAGGLPASG